MSNELTVVKTLTPDIWGMIASVAEASYESRQFGIKKQGEAAIKILFCYENGLPLTAANTGLYIVKEKLAVQSNIIAAKFRMHPMYDYEIGQHDNTLCEITILRRHSEDGELKKIGVSKFDEADAKKAGLLAKDNWRNYPKNMYFGRAITNAYRWFAPDLFSQPIYIPEELGMTVDAEGSPIIEGEIIEDNNEITLDDLLSKYTPEEIWEANNGGMPTSQAELIEINEKLSGDKND